ncbi:MAG: cation transporter, partial [Leptonema sp. (in: Bacteria)]|nr:cation transporter [Leptonema sp. (in: bacteria)]
MLRKVYPLIIAFALGLVILFFKLVAFYISNSMALKSDALESLVNLLAGSFAIFAVLYAHKPADRDHPYGHGKIEFVSSFFEGGLISLAAVLICYEAIENLIVGVKLKQLDYGLAINFAAGSANGILGLWLVYIGRKKKSAAIEADGTHLLSDFVTTLGIAVGLLAVHFTGLSFLDPALALVFGVWLGYTGVRVLVRSILSLMDTENPEIIQNLLDSMNTLKHPFILEVHAMRAIHTGHYVHIDIHLVMPEIFDVRKANAVVHDFEQQVLKTAGISGEFHSHIDPCEQRYCSHCPVENCWLRLEPCTEPRPTFIADTAVSWP